MHQSWVEMLTSAFTHNHRLLVESDFDTERGTHGVIRTLTLTRE